jgi:hypothetical protein
VTSFRLFENILNFFKHLWTASQIKHHIIPRQELKNKAISKKKLIILHHSYLGFALRELGRNLIEHRDTLPA